MAYQPPLANFYNPASSKKKDEDDLLGLGYTYSQSKPAKTDTVQNRKTKKSNMLMN